MQYDLYDNKRNKIDVTNKIKFFPKNTKGRTFVVGDLHGCYPELMHFLHLIGFDQEQDMLYATGDLIDRGYDNMQALGLLYEPWFRSVRGNHDDMMIRTLLLNDDTMRTTWQRNGGMWYLSEDQGELRAIAKDMIGYMPNIIVVGDDADRFNIVHAEIIKRDVSNGHPERIPVTDKMIDSYAFSEDDIDNQLWGRNLYDTKVYRFPNYPRCHDENFMSMTFCGHTTVEATQRVEQQIFLDGGGVFAGYHCQLTAPWNALTIADPYRRIVYRYNMHSHTMTETYLDMAERFH